ncbi:hypothetical protein GCM10011571_08660 [Marinithermofilum abyssi]|uniref:PGAP1-like protein n=1 Tax=Marinithermofilum abyssi TaxID=1571185 RepID=A0A8J2VBQ2_9BACL|nr:hypothetical protein [Marinithermofilum abyssi]GGE09616.1 hypothetical protein GCM10011571_08660 [Marinithermofilum abyssi]
MKRGLGVLTTGMFWAAGSVHGKEGRDAPPPQPIRRSAADVSIQGYTPGTWYIGATPPLADRSKPPIVFVPGLNGKAQDWWEDTEYYGTNDMYAYAYNQGYRTAFVQLYDAAGNGAADMWDNGKLLAGLLTDIHHYFGEPVNIVAHSKGGIDAQSALIHYGAWPHVGRVVTLSSPHRGSHLADLAFSWWAGWLAELIGARDEGTESLQTGYMEHFRSVTDEHRNAGKNTYYTAAGTDWGPFPSALWTGGAYLSVHGENDGLVNVWSTPLPYARHLYTEEWDHDAIRLGRTSFPRVDPYLRSIKTADPVGHAEVAAAGMAAVPSPSGGEQVVRGGKLTAGQVLEEGIAVPDSLEQGIFQVLTDQDHVTVKLESPDGTIYSARSREYIHGTDHQVFASAHVQAFQIPTPQRGLWKVRLESPEDGAYLLTATLKGAERVRVQIAMSDVEENRLSLTVHIPSQQGEPQLRATVWVVPPRAFDGNQMGQQAGEMVLSSTGKGRFTGSVPVQESGVYNITIDLKGKDDKGMPYQRTIIRSVYVPRLS